MAVHPDVSRQYVRREMCLVDELADIYGWEVCSDYDGLIVIVRMQAHTGDRFIVEARCDHYKEMPPYIEFTDPVSGEKGIRRAYPRPKSDSFFHRSGPCICAPFNRKAYKSVVATGPHGDWDPSDWMNSTAGGVRWSNYSTLGDMFGLIQTRLSRPDLYGGRMAA